MTSPAFADHLPSLIPGTPLDTRPSDVPAVRLLGLPDRLDPTALADGVVEVSERDRPDAVVLTQPNAAHLLSVRLPTGLAGILPVIDASRGFGPARGVNQRRADVQIAAPNRAGLAEAVSMLAAAIERLRALPETVLLAEDPRLVLLARLMVRERAMEPRRDPHVRETVVYPDEHAIAGALVHAEDLVTLGLVRREFFDMLIVCPRCDSGRLSAHERCASCGSADLAEEAIFHHLRCAYQAPEREFRTASGFVCPKCRARLESFSIDYDRPGLLSVCNACGHASGETSVGFVCLDCQAENRAGETASRAIHRYELAASAHHCLHIGTPLPAPGTGSRMVVYRIRSFIARQVAAGKPFCILSIELEKPSGRSPIRLYQQTCGLFASLMRETFTPETAIIDLTPRFLALLADDRKDDVEDALPEIRAALERFLVAPLRVNYRVYGPDEIDDVIDAVQHVG